MVDFEDGTLVKGAYVVIDGKEYEVHMPEYSGKTPISSENLNKIQNDLSIRIDNITTTTILYDDINGTQSDITLSNTTLNYSKIKIYYRDRTGKEYINEAENLSDTINLLLEAGYLAGDNDETFQIAFNEIILEDNTLKLSKYGYVNLKTGETPYLGNANYIYITKVEGIN